MPPAPNMVTPMTDMRRLAFSAAACLVTILTARAQTGAPPPQAVRVDRVTLEDIRDRQLVTGELRATRSSAVAGREPGLVVEVPAREGDRVAEGAILARVDDRHLQLEIAQLVADRAVADATLVERQADLGLSTWQQGAFAELATRGSSYEKELREAEAAIAVARAKVTQAERQLDLIDARRALIEQRVADTVIVAPFDAIVVARRVEQGGWLGAGGAVVDVVSATDIEAWFEVPESLAASTDRPNTRIEVRLTAIGETRFAESLRVVPQVSAQTRTFPIVIPLDNPDGVLKPGMSATAWIPTGAEGEQLTIDRDAILRNDAGAYVWVARGGAGGDPPLAIPVPIELLFTTGERVAIRAAALKPGDALVVEGNERLLPRTPLAWTEPAPSPPTPRRDNR